MSPRAASRLESLGFSQVYEYRPGKADWLAAGLPTEGTGAPGPRILQYVSRDVPTCRQDETVADAAARAAEAGWNVCMVVNEQGILLGRLDEKELHADGPRSVERAMGPGPSTYRPDALASKLRHLMTHRGIDTLPVTTPEGRLLGVIRRDALERADEEIDADSSSAGSRR